MVKGRGMIRPMKTAISKTRRQKTYVIQIAMVSIQRLITEDSHGSIRYKGPRGGCSKLDQRHDNYHVASSSHRDTHETVVESHRAQQRNSDNLEELVRLTELEMNVGA